ncbi:MAG TPA: glycoside hydrolase family 78 protein [Roseiflexaceae bacterium]|nr:glycoside hydrolase family 78 protein [Roseiflexaceae bacterium]
MTQQLHVGNLRCEYRSNPLGIDVAEPRLSWQLQSDERGARQTAYQVLVASSPEKLADGQGDLWDSGKINSDQSIQVAYAGSKLGSGQRAWWTVRRWGQDGQASDYAEPAWWEIGLLDRADWAGQWIGGPLAGGKHSSSPSPFLRTQFTLDKPVAQARLYITALGLYEPHLNGQIVGEDVLMPGWTDYNKRVRYQVYDVGAQLQQGENALGAILGDGWYCGNVAWYGRQNYGDRPQLLAQLAITFEDGSTQTVATDEQWKVAYGPILESDMLMGESYDARRELSGWDAAGFDDASWWSATAFPDNGAALEATDGPPIRRQEQLRPQSIRELSEYHGSNWIVDMGQNMVGWVRLRVSGPAGTTVRLRYAEVLNPDGTIYTTNLRAARNTDYYTLKGEGEEVWEPHFLFHGFRYVELNSFPGEVTEDTVTGIVVHSDMPRTGTFACSDPLINQLQHNIEWGQKGNFVDVPTDCPQRDERLGWTGDAQVFIRTAAWNRNVAGFFTKWLKDLEDAQAENGAYPKFAPILSPRDADGGPAWSDAGTICPWTIYTCYGDTRIIEQQYDSMKRFVEFMNDTSRDGLRNYPGYEGWQGFGDWLALDGSVDRFGITPKDLIGTAFFSYSARLLARMASVIGREEDAARYNGLADKARDAFQKHYVTPDGLIAGGTQTCYVLALYFDLLPEQARATALEALVSDIKRRGMHLSTGFVGTPYLTRVLSDNGRADVAYALLHQQTWPSWLYSVTQGATTIWERWDGWTHDKGFQDPSMNSFNHYAYGAIGEWMYAVVAGIDADPEQPGYRHIIMRPQPGGGLTNVAADIESVYGRVGSAWQLRDGAFTWQITVPANASATVYVPAADGADVREGDETADKASGVRFLRREGNAAVYEVGSGTYQFISQLPA